MKIYAFERIKLYLKPDQKRLAIDSKMPIASKAMGENCVKVYFLTQTIMFLLELCCLFHSINELVPRTNLNVTKLFIFFIFFFNHLGPMTDNNIFYK